MDAFTIKGLQHLFDRASLRHDLADQEQDFEEASMCFAEMLAIMQLVEAYGWLMDQGVIFPDGGE